MVNASVVALFGRAVVVELAASVPVPVRAATPNATSEPADTAAGDVASVIDVSLCTANTSCVAGVAMS